MVTADMLDKVIFRCLECGKLFCGVCVTGGREGVSGACPDCGGAIGHVDDGKQKTLQEQSAGRPMRPRPRAEDYRLAQKLAKISQSLNYLYATNYQGYEHAKSQLDAICAELSSDPERRMRVKRQAEAIAGRRIEL